MKLFRSYYLLFIFLLPLIPSYLGIRAGFGLINFQRILLLPLAILILWQVMRGKGAYLRIKNSIKSIKWISILFFLFVMLRLLASIFGESPESSVRTAIYEIFSYFIIYCATAIYIDTPKRMSAVILTLSFSLVIVCGLTLIEKVSEQNLFANFSGASDADENFLSQALTSKMRGGEYRAQGTFYNPLSLAHYLVTLLPLLIFVKHPGILFGRWRLLFIAVVFASIWATGSRAAALLGILTIFFWSGGFVLKLVKSKHGLNKFFGSAGAAGLLIGLLAAASISANTISGGNGSDEESASTLARYSQVTLGLKSIAENPALGIGVGLSQTVAGISVNESRVSIDNYYLSLAIETGIPVLVIFLLIIVFLIARAAAVDKNSLLRNIGITKWAVINFSVFLLISSLYSEVFPIFLVLMGLIASYKLHYKSIG